jgi:hypothetical protein
MVDLFLALTTSFGKWCLSCLVVLSCLGPKWWIYELTTIWALCLSWKISGILIRVQMLHVFDARALLLPAACSGPALVFVHSCTALCSPHSGLLGWLAVVRNHHVRVVSAKSAAGVLLCSGIGRGSSFDQSS